MLARVLITIAQKRCNQYNYRCGPNASVTVMHPNNNYENGQDASVGASLPTCTVLKDKLEGSFFFPYNEYDFN